MPDAAAQLAFELPPRSRLGRADFLPGRSNEAALRLVEAWPDWPARLLHLAGPPGSGKSHIMAIWAERSGATLIEAAEITTGHVPALVAAGPIALDNVDRAETDGSALFHLVNGAREGGADILFTSEGRLDPERIRLPDLLSRLRLAPRAVLDAPDDELLAAVLEKLFADRQLVVDPTVVAYLGHRVERSLEAARAVVAALDAEALRRGRRITRAMAAALLGDARGTTPAADEEGA